MKTIHPIYDVYFRIEAGYNDGRMSHEQHDRFYTEICIKEPLPGLFL